MIHSLANVHKVALIGSYSPRQCGIATFTTDLVEALACSRPDIACLAIAMNDPGKRYDYPVEVAFQIDQNEPGDYLKCARFLEANDVDLLCVQHEFGIFGGPAGSHLLDLLDEVRIPVVATLHTILERPNSAQRAVMERLTRRASKLVVMSAKGKSLLESVYGVPGWKVDHIPHGVPTPNLDAGDSLRAKHALEDKTVLLTFGLLSPDKGIENVIDALPHIAAEKPNVTYMVVGATHPHVRAHSGEAYREALTDRARELGVEDRVIFHNEFVSLCELTGYLAMADVYVTPYLKEEQITSGTLAYAIGCGKAVVSTPYWYAAELLADDRGILVPWRDPMSIASAVVDLLTDTEHRTSIEARAMAFGEGMQWPRVASEYWRVFGDSLLAPKAIPASAIVRGISSSTNAYSGALDLRHVKRMTDDTGMIQHARHNVPNYNEGYCLDDNARALLLISLARQAGLDPKVDLDALESTYLAFVFHAFCPETGLFRNFMSYDRRWLEEHGSEDSHGRALWALGTASRRLADPGRASLSGSLFHEALPAALQFTSPRAWAYTLLGIDEALRASPSEPLLEQVGERLAVRLSTALKTFSSPEWNWFEPVLSYCNARLSEALLVSGQWLEREEMVREALNSLDWLTRLQTGSSGLFEPIGCDRVMKWGEAKPIFDQQPVEANCTISACAKAWRATRDVVWKERAMTAFEWYQGGNHLDVPLYDEATGGCFDGLSPRGVNRNQGAESTLSFQLAIMEMIAAGFIGPHRSTKLVHIH